MDCKFKMLILTVFLLGAVKSSFNYRMGRDFDTISHFNRNIDGLEDKDYPILKCKPDCGDHKSFLLRDCEDCECPEYYDTGQRQL